LKYPTSHLTANIELIKNAKIVYSSSFFITSNNEALKTVMSTRASLNKPFGFNLSACFLMQFNPNEVLEGLKHADYIFANEDEAAFFAKTYNVANTSLKDVAIAI